MADVPGGTDALQARLDALRASGTDGCDPVRFVTLQALARRAASQPEAIRQILLVKMNALADELAARPAPTPTEIPPVVPASPLADLLAYISQHAHEPPHASQPTPENTRLTRSLRQKAKNSPARASREGPELKSVAYFHKTWSKLSTEQQLTQTLAQAPENAGPMNSQHLVLRSLQAMRDISPDYLQGFMSYIDTLIWLDHADPTKPVSGRASGGETAKKTRTAKRGTTNR